MANNNDKPSKTDVAFGAANGRVNTATQAEQNQGNGWEHSFHLSQAHLASMLDTAGDAIIAVDDQHCITLFNQNAEYIFGYAAQEVLGQSIERLLPARFRDIYNQQVTALASAPEHTRRKVLRQDIYGLRKDGSEFPAEVAIAKFEIGGEATYTTILRDITARLAIEQALQAENLALERASRAKDRFLERMSHELRTPLNAIIGFTGTLLMRLPGPLTADQARQLQTVQASAKHLLTLINSLLDLARIESGRIELHREPVVCQDVIAEVATALRPLAERKSLRIETHVPQHTLRLTTDQRTLTQILIHLVNNAIIFTDTGTIFLEVELNHWRPITDEPNDMPVIGHQPSAIEFRVADTGIGIPSEAQAQLFDAFADIPVARAHERTGLGLHLSQKLAALLGGTIEFSSQLGQGSTFILLLPGP